MSVVSLLNVKIRNNPAAFTAPYQFEITFECLENLREDLEWKLTYVGSATSSEHDQELDSLLVGPVPVGVNKFLFEADPPDLSRIPSSELLGVTVILLTCSYDGREFVRVGYYVNNQYPDQYPELQADPPAKPIVEKIERNILADKPRVTRFAIKWDSEESAPAEFPPDQPEADTADDDGELYGAEEDEDDNEEAPAGEAEGEDTEMGGAEETATAKAPVEEEDDDDAGSEDLEADSDDDDEDDLDDEEGEGEDEADEDMEMGEDEQKAANGAPLQHQQQQETMVH